MNDAGWRYRQWSPFAVTTKSFADRAGLPETGYRERGERVASGRKAARVVQDRDLISSRGGNLSSIEYVP